MVTPVMTLSITFLAASRSAVSAISDWSRGIVTTRDPVVRPELVEKAMSGLPELQAGDRLHAVGIDDNHHVAPLRRRRRWRLRGCRPPGPRLATVVAVVAAE